MRKLPNDTLSDPVRRCILTGERAERQLLTRLALGPDASVHADVRARAPGRGAWIGVGRAELETALAKGKLQGALARSFKGKVDVPGDLPDAIEAALAQTVLDRLGIEARSGALVTGFDKIDVAARRGEIALLLHASDAATDGRRKLDQALRVGRDAEGSELAGTLLPLDRERLSMALGKDNVVHLALIRRDAASRVADLLRRQLHFLGEDITSLAPFANTSMLRQEEAAC